MAGVPDYRKFKFPKPKKGEGSPGNFGLPSPGEVVRKVGRAMAAKPAAGGRMGAKAAASVRPPKPTSAPKRAKSVDIGKAADRAFASQKRSEDYKKSRDQLGGFYLNATSGMFSEKAGGKKK